MKFEIDLNVNASEGLIRAIEALTLLLPDVKLNVAKNSDNDKESAAKTGDAEESASSAKTITLEHVRSKLANLAQSGKQEQVKALIQKYGASRLSEINPGHYEQILKEAEEIK